MMNQIKFLDDEKLVKVYSWCAYHERINEKAPETNAVRFLLGAGVRVGEACQIPLELISGVEFVIPHTKAGGPRRGKLMPEAQPFFLNWVKRRFMEAETNREKTPWLLFPYSKRTIQRWWKAMLAECGIEYIPTHSSRKTFIVWEIVRKRLSIAELTKLVGHKDWRITEAHYFDVMFPLLWEDPAKVRWPDVAINGPREAANVIPMKRSKA